MAVAARRRPWPVFLRLQLGGMQLGGMQHGWMQLGVGQCWQLMVVGKTIAEMLLGKTKKKGVGVAWGEWWNGGTGGRGGGAGGTARGGWGRWAIRRGMVWRSGNIWGWGKVIQNKGRGEGTELEKNEKRRMIMPSLPCSLYSRSIYTREINKIENA